MGDQHVGERRDDRDGYAAESELDLAVVEVDVGNGEPGDLEEGPSVEQDQQRDHTVLSVTGRSTA